MDHEVEQKLALRLQAGIQAWTRALEGDEKPGGERDILTDTDSPITTVVKPGGDPKIQLKIHEIRITNQVMYVNPSVEEARFALLQELFAWQNVVLTLNRIESSRYQVGLDRPQSQQFRDLLNKIPESNKILDSAYNAIESKIRQMRDYIQQWLTYQSLWDLQPDQLYAKLG